ncbi:MAG: hypothetical protein ACK5KQ_00735 [Anaerorhabdus sp.]
MSINRAQFLGIERYDEMFDSIDSIPYLVNNNLVFIMDDPNYKGR